MPYALEPIIRTCFVTPDMHHVHHSAARHQTDSNYGDLLSCWDHLFGTYVALDRAALCKLRFGLGDIGDQHSASIVRQLSAPLRRNRTGPLPTSG
jgi:sterol desaturase/sphingolipid hydroxylase (fatty acid hydroxylase superfamily)